MGIRITRGAIVPAIALVALTGAAAPAAAMPQDTVPTISTTSGPEEDTLVHTEPPAEPEEEITDAPEDNTEPEPEPTGKPTPPADWPYAEYCGPGTTNVYTPKTQGKKYHKGVGPTLSNYNRTSRTARSTFTSEVTGEVGVSVTAGLTVGVNVMLAKLEAKYDVNLSAKLTAKLGNTIAVDTPAKKTTNAKYGVYRLKHTGVSYKMYSNCSTSPKKTITSYSPYRVGWYLWED